MKTEQTKESIFINYAVKWLEKIQDSKNFSFFLGTLGGFGHDFYSHLPKNSGVNADYWNLLYSNLQLIAVIYYKYYATNIKLQKITFVGDTSLELFIKFLKEYPSGSLPTMPTNIVLFLREGFWQIWYLTKMIANEK